ncbi:MULTISPECIES: potassium channel family protein [Streptomyces]|uniref:Potassium transporter TrkA n=2 Tax=Streptomyces TaxID=1883 RepID=A0A100YA47_9ACTN|nr:MULTISPECIES: potassium channel protein [Streptomyces]KUH40393.1 potassium transporter TrkA [Streptomyces kanasensis]UUS29843.1 NAD-binding protein [Streptomyces changanensis]
MALPPRRDQGGHPTGHMVVCGDDGLARRLASELWDVYREPVVLVVPGGGAEVRLEGQPCVLSHAAGPMGRTGPATRRSVGTAADDANGGHVPPIREVPADSPTDAALLHAGVDRAAALALLYEDDETNLRAALAARRLSPGLRLVVRMYNRKLGQHMEELLDQAALLAEPGMDRAALAASTTVLSDADTAAPALAATAVAGTSKVVQADGLLLCAAERTPPGQGEVPDPGLCTLALLSSTTSDPAGAEGSDASGSQGPLLLPDDRAVRAAAGRGTVVLETVRHAAPVRPPRRLSRSGARFGELFSARLRWALAGIVASVLALTVTTTVLTDADPVHAAYLTLLDLFSINDPAVDEPVTRQVLQLLAGLVGLALLPLLVAGALEALGTFRATGALRRPPRGLSGHVVLLGLGKVGARVLTRLRELDIPVVCVEEDPDARGLPLARRLGVPVVLGDVTEEGVLEAAKVHRAHALLALTSSDTTNLEATLSARTLRTDLRVALRLYDDDFATAVHRTLRAAHPDALTRSRSVTHLAAPAFAGAMMGRQVLGAIPVERKVLVFAALLVAGQPRLEGRTVAEAFRPGAWRIVALDTAAPAARRPDLASAHRDGERPQLLWDLHPGYVLRPEDRVVVAATRGGLADLLGRGTAPRGTPTGPRRRPAPPRQGDAPVAPTGAGA